MEPPILSTRVRVTFALTAILLIGQFGFILRFCEPYPAIVMPRFSGSGGYRHGQVELDRFDAVFVTKHEKVSFSSQMLLRDFPTSYHLAIGLHALKAPGESSRPSVKKPQLAPFWNTILPGLIAGRESRNSPENRASLKAWLQGRAKELLPDRCVSHVEIRWFRDSLRIDGGEVHAQREPAGSLMVALEGEG